MRIVRCSGRLLGRGLRGGGGGCLPRGVCPGVSAQGGCLPGGRRVSAQGVSSQGVSAQGGVWPGGVCPGGLPRGVSGLWTEWQTGVKTLPCHNYVADGNK